MSKFEGHSPGPWWVDNDTKGFGVWANLGRAGAMKVCSCGYAGFDISNAELIAAAPDLLAERNQLREAFEKFINQVHENALEPDKLYIYEGRARAALKEAGE